MYDQTGGEIQAIEGILRELTKEGYKFVTVDELQEWWLSDKIGKDRFSFFGYTFRNGC
jgi:hypothetical protein